MVEPPDEQIVIDEILEALGHLPPPPGAFTASQYVARARERGAKISANSVMNQLNELVEKGTLRRGRFRVDRRPQICFWKVDRDEQLGRGDP